ncbi:MAG: hypothetical protein KGL18_18305 [Burkholderiales bacterium]|nr:hypothetical protein [Burkholderiales bacterium]MDE1925764.1 hypothetical protein [Burkholderiales bacterium]MDE2504920.1 hypothetical protein [Burkholderiales bacterium]
MSLLIALVANGPAAGLSPTIEAAALANAASRGFIHPTRLEWPGGHALWFATPASPRSSGGCLVEGRRFAAYTGTVHWKGLTGEALLRRLLREFSRPQDMPLRDFSGGFAMLFSQGDEVWLFSDAVGLQQFYATCAGSVISNSLYLCRSLLRRPQLNRLRAQEYVLLGSNHATETPLQEIRAHDASQMVDLRSGARSTLHAAADWRVNRSFATTAEAVETLSSLIDTDFEGMLQAFGPQIGMALSGGFDSRLLLAALQRHGIAPDLYVYGAPDDDDVRIAAAKASELGMPIACIDKRQINSARPPIDRPLIAGNLAFFDGLPVDGVFDRGADQITRQLQMTGGRLNLNGGGGEILRNFFYLPDRAYSATELVGAFYSNWMPRAVPDSDERRELHEATADGILGELGFESGTLRTRARKLPRVDVELVYTLFRLRWWMARNNTIATLHGAFMTPLAHPRLIELAAQVPLAWKTDGDLEAAVITRLAPAVARGPSNYGFDFSRGPGAAHRRYMNATLVRPIMIRRASARLRRLLGRNPSIPSPAEWQRAFPLPAVDWIDVRYLTDSGQWNRLLTLCALLDDGL